VLSIHTRQLFRLFPTLHSLSTNIIMAFPKFPNKILQIFLFLFNIFFIPLLIFSSLPFFLQRTIIKPLAKICRTDLGNIVETKSSLQSIDNIFESPKCNVVSCYIIEGTTNIDTLRASVKRFFKTTFQDSQGRQDAHVINNSNNTYSNGVVIVFGKMAKISIM